MLFVFKSVAIVFPLLVDISFILHLQQLVSGMTQFYFTGVHLEFLEDRGLKFLERERGRERQREAERERGREWERVRKRQRDRHRQTDRQADRDRIKIGTNSRVHFYWPTTIENSWRLSSWIVELLFLHLKNKPIK